MTGVSNDRASALSVLLIGGGGRDHALAWTFARSPRCGELHAAPGNVGIAKLATCHDVALDDIEGIVAIAARVRPDLVVIGPEDLLVAGLASRLHEIGITCLGPSAAAARLEGSKTYSKQLMERTGVPTPAWRACDSVESAHAAIEELGGSVAVKADGLAAGCGAYVCWTPEAARAAVHELMIDRRFGASGAQVIVEQLVDGDEVSVMALVDGRRVLPLPTARDYKRLGDGDAGPNTGGMGAHAPSTQIEPAEAAELAVATIQPVIDAMRADGAEYRGIVYAGVMLTADGPLVLEYNCRFGNPETQALVRVVESDLLGLLYDAASGSLPTDIDQISPHGAAAAVCIAAEHYPEQQLEPAPVLVRGLDAARAVPGVQLFAGLAEDVAGTTDEILAAGGRVVTVSAWAPDLAEAVDRAYRAADSIQVAGRQARTDIGRSAVAAAR